MDLGYSELVPLRTSGRRVPLFCVGGGWLGNDNNFQDMAAVMLVDQPVYQLRMVSLYTTSLRLSIEQLAANFLHRVCKAQEHGPYRLLGYSFGASVVYAMAVDLVSRGEKVDLLALVDAPNPAWVSSAEFSRFRKAYIANRVKKYLKNLSSGRIDYVIFDLSKYVGHNVAPRINQKMRQALGRPPSSKPLMMTEMWNAYAPPRFDGPLVIFRAEDRIEFHNEPSLGWHKSAQRVDVHFVPGDHVMMMRMPNVLTLVEKLVPYLASPSIGG